MAGFFVFLFFLAKLKKTKKQSMLRMKMAKKMGYLINIQTVIHFDSSKNLFAPYLEDLSEIRVNHPKGHPYNDMAKRLGNALYGRFAISLFFLK